MRLLPQIVLLACGVVAMSKEMHPDLGKLGNRDKDPLGLMNGGPGGLGRPHDLAAKAQKWKSMVGQNGQEVAEQIRQEDGIRMVQVVKEGSPMTMDVRHDRVRVMVDNAGIVTRAPRIG